MSKVWYLSSRFQATIISSGHWSHMKWRCCSKKRSSYTLKILCDRLLQLEDSARFETFKTVGLLIIDIKWFGEIVSGFTNSAAMRSHCSLGLIDVV